MNSRRLALTGLWLHCLAALPLVPWPASAADPVPGPRQVFSSRTVAALYVDLRSAAQSGIARALQEQAPALWQQIPGRSDGRAGLRVPPSALEALKPGDLVELAVAFEGANALKNLESGRYDADFGFVAAMRLAPGVDMTALLESVLAEYEKEQPGLRGRLMESRTQVGAADFFDLPADALGQPSLPPDLSLAFGPGQDGGIIGLGRKESLRAYLTGRSEGVLPPKVTDFIARRGQAWLYVPIPRDAGGELAANPALAGLARELGKVREFGLALSFGEQKADFELAFGCEDSATAKQLSDTVQGFVGMMQMAGNQSSQAVPPFLSKLKATADGVAFRLTTELTLRDMELALENARRMPTGTREPARGAVSVVKPLVPPGAPPVDFEVLELLPGEAQALRFARVRIQNRSTKPVHEVRVTFAYWDEQGRKLGEWTRLHADPEAEDLVGAETNRVFNCPTFHVPTFTVKVTATLQEVIFAGGDKWVRPS